MPGLFQPLCRVELLQRGTGRRQVQSPCLVSCCERRHILCPSRGTGGSHSPIRAGTASATAHGCSAALEHTMNPGLGRGDGSPSLLALTWEGALWHPGGPRSVVISRHRVGAGHPGSGTVHWALAGASLLEPPDGRLTLGRPSWQGVCSLQL